MCCSANAAPFPVPFEAQFQWCQGSSTLTLPASWLGLLWAQRHLVPCYIFEIYCAHPSALRFLLCPMGCSIPWCWPKAAGWGELWRLFQIVFCHLCNEKKECGCNPLFMEKGVDQLQMAVGSILWEMRGNCQNDIVEKLWKYFHAERLYLLPSRFGIAHHTSKQEVHWGPHYLICLTGYFTPGRFKKQCRASPSTLSYCLICIIVLSLFPPPYLFCHLIYLWFNMNFDRAALAMTLCAEWNLFLTFCWACESESKCPWKSYHCQCRSSIAHAPSVRSVAK